MSALAKLADLERERVTVIRHERVEVWYGEPQGLPALTSTVGGQPPLVLQAAAMLLTGLGRGGRLAWLGVACLLLAAGALGRLMLDEQEVEP